MHNALMMTRSFPREVGFTKLLVIPGGGNRAGKVKSFGESLVKLVDPMIMRGENSQGNTDMNDQEIWKLG